MVFEISATMNCAMTVQAGPSKVPVAGAAAEESTFCVVRSSWVARPIMTILAEVGNFLYHQLVVTASMRSVADSAVFFYRRMLINVWSPLVGMTLVAKLIVVVRLDHGVRQGAVRIVAITALYFAFVDRMVRLFVGIYFNVFVAAETNRRLSHYVGRLMNLVAGYASDIVLLVRAHVPIG